MSSGLVPLLWNQEYLASEIAIDTKNAIELAKVFCSIAVDMLTHESRPSECNQDPLQNHPEVVAKHMQETKQILCFEIKVSMFHKASQTLD
eukprot:5342878-Amphidinium_carterae.1